MFSDAINIAKQFTQLVVICRRTAKGVCSSSIGSFVVVNDDGWIVTAGHILKHIFQLSAEAQAARDHETKVAAIRGDSNLTPKERSKQLSALGRVKDDSTDRFCVIWGQFPGVQLHDAVAFNAVDLAIGRLEPFDKNVIKSYPTFKDPSKNFEPGMSLCKLGFPFHHIAPTYNSANDQFVLPPEAFPMPLFPMDGIFTRIQLFNPPAGVAGPSYRTMYVETSTPGLRGQSGGPTFDTNGTVWAIQSLTQHLPLGFNPPVPGTKTGEQEHQFLNVGLGVHTETIFGLFRDRGVTNIQMSTY